MNELNQLEQQLRSWTPRPPSAALKARIFKPAPVAEGEVDCAGHRQRDDATRVPTWQWLAPAMAVFVFAMMSWTDSVRSSFISSTGSDASALSNPELAAYRAPTHIGHNAWPIATFDWTNRRQSLATAAPVLVTNSTVP